MHVSHSFQNCGNLQHQLNQNKVSWCYIEYDHSFEGNEDGATVFLKQTDFNTSRFKITKKIEILGISYDCRKLLMEIIVFNSSSKPTKSSLFLTQHLKLKKQRYVITKSSGYKTYWSTFFTTFYILWQKWEDFLLVLWENWGHYNFHLNFTDLLWNKFIFSDSLFTNMILWDFNHCTMYMHNSNQLVYFKNAFWRPRTFVLEPFS